MNVSPEKITANRNSAELTIVWNDGHTSVYPFGLLRAACPCASCRGGHENMRSDPDPEVFFHVLPDSPQTRLKNIEGIGSYAISFEERCMALLLLVFGLKIGIICKFIRINVTVWLCF